jgi:hypothetical protein
MILPEYLDTVFKATEPQGGWPGLFHIITAWNPGVSWSLDENNEANRKLLVLLQALGSPFKVIGCSPCLKYQEEGFGVTGLSREQAVEIGSQYGQNAIFEVSNDALIVIGCLSNKSQSLGNWSGRLKNQ